jgi:hypothetical protein
MMWRCGGLSAFVFGCWLCRLSLLSASWPGPIRRCARKTLSAVQTRVDWVAGSGPAMTDGGVGAFAGGGMVPGAGGESVTQEANEISAFLASRELAVYHPCAQFNCCLPLRLVRQPEPGSLLSSLFSS